jgi:hypothetical protein
VKTSSASCGGIIASTGTTARRPLADAGVGDVLNRADRVAADHTTDDETAWHGTDLATVGGVGIVAPNVHPVVDDIVHPLDPQRLPVAWIAHHHELAGTNPLRPPDQQPITRRQRRTHAVSLDLHAGEPPSADEGRDQPRQEDGGQDAAK